MLAKTQAADPYRVLILPHTRRDGDVTCALFERSGLTCQVLERAAKLATEIERAVGAVVLTDAAFSDRDIERFLVVLERQPAWSDVPVVLLTQAGIESPETARLRGALKNVTLLNRPTSVRTLLSSVQAALRGRARQYQIRDQMQRLRETEEAVRIRERQLHTLADNSPDILTRFDSALRHVFVNKAAVRTTGFVGKDFIGRTSREIGLPQELCDVWERSVREVFSVGEVRNVEFTYSGPPQRRHYTSALVPEFAPGGQVETVLCVTRDVTERKNAEDALRLADRRKDEFLAMLAHELRNPLAPIRNASELLERTLPGDDRTQGTVAIVKRQVAHLTRLVDDLLDVSRITQGRIELQRRPLEVAAIIAQALESVDPLLREKRHRVLLDSSYPPLYVNADNARLAQCFINVLTNAAKYTDPGGKIGIAVREEDGSAVVTVSDNGVGISAELLPRIFDLFVQSERSLDRSQGGLGIGLSVVQRLIEMHDGRVSVSSEGQGCGSTFVIRLPLTTPAAATAGDRPARQAPPRRVLVVDDNQDAAQSLAQILSLNGHTAESVFGPEAALERLAAFRPEVVLLDIGLPRMDGYELARRIRGGECQVQLIALTGYGQREDIERAAAAGFDAHLVKPVDFSALDRILEQGIHSHERRQV
jgi:PAS domain S-box-containing protein